MYNPVAQEVERLLLDLKARVARAESRMTQAEQGVSQLWQQVGGGGGIGTPSVLKLTSNGNGSGLHDWEEYLYSGGSYSSTGLTGTAAGGDGAREVDLLDCPAGDEYYVWWRDAMGATFFKATRQIGVADADINAGSTGTVSVWSYSSGTAADSGLNVTGVNWNSLTKVTGTKRVMLTPCGNKWLIDFEEC